MNRFTYRAAEGERSVEYELTDSRLTVDGLSYPCDGHAIWLEGRRVPFWVQRSAGRATVWLDGETYTFDYHDPRQRTSSTAEAGDFSGRVTAQMPGKILSLSVRPGDTVRRGQNLLVMESMKMELALDAPADGTVESVAVAVGQLVALGETLVKLSP